MRSPSMILVVNEEEGASISIVPCAKLFERRTDLSGMKSSEGFETHGSNDFCISPRMTLLDIFVDVAPLRDPHVSSELAIALRSINAE